MNLKKTAAIILAAALLLCSCGSSEAEESGGGRITRGSETAETVAETKDAEKLDETAETLETSQNITSETAAENAEVIFKKAGELFEKAKENESSYTHFIYIGVLGKTVAAMPELPDKVNGEYIENALNYLTKGEIGGVYAIVIETSGEISGVIWSPSFNSTVVAIYPYQIADGNDMTLSDQLLEMYEMEDSFNSDINTQTANANAKLVFQNAATYLTKAQIAGATMDSLLIFGRIGEKTDEFPQIESGAALTGDDLTNALSYYMGRDNAGVYTILLDEQLNPRAVLWAKDTQTSVVGAFPVARTVAENEGINIYSADIHKAAGD
jgi:hypothetical protein